MMFRMIEKGVWTRRCLVVTAVVSVYACQDTAAPVLPTDEQVEGYFTYSGELSAAVNGNVAELTVVQPASQIRRGGSLWAKVGPYVLLFSDETRQLLTDYPDVAGVRIVTRTSAGGEIARALLVRTELSDILWRRSLNIAGKARRDGSQRPRLLEELVRWGEEHTEYEYNPRYTDG